jgi:hypothetical protein
VVRFEIDRTEWTPELITEFQPSIEVNPWGFGLAHEVLNGSEAWTFTAEKQRAIIAVKPVRRMQGARLDVVALVSTGDRLQADLFGQAIDQLAANYNAAAIAMTTQIHHVRHVAQRTGWVDAGFLMRKDYTK